MPVGEMQKIRAFTVTVAAAVDKTLTFLSGISTGFVISKEIANAENKSTV